MEVGRKKHNTNPSIYIYFKNHKRKSERQPISWNDLKFERQKVENRAVANCGHAHFAQSPSC